MKKYLKELIILVLQMFIFYISPLFAKTTDAIGMVLLIIITTFMLSFVMGIISKKKIKYLYPVIVSILFIPTIFIYYNESAFIHIIWYLIDSVIGLLLGIGMRKIVSSKSKNTEDNYISTGMCIGMSLGCSIGLCIGEVTNNVPVCMSLGICLGTMLGLVVGCFIKKNDKEKNYNKLIDSR